MNFAAYCGKVGYNTLLVDIDPQTNATFSCISPEDWQEHAAKHGTVANLLGVRYHTSAEPKKIAAKDVIIPDVFDGVDLLPSHLDLFTVDLDMAGATAREQRLKQSLKTAVDKYSIIVCDCPPNLTIPTQNVLAMCTHYVVPVSPDFLSSLGIALLVNRIGRLSEELENPMEHVGIVLSRVGRKSSYRTQTIETLRDSFENVFSNVLKERSDVSEATAKNISVFDTNNREAIKEFTGVSKELLKSVGLK